MTDIDPPEEPEGFGLLIPFVCVTSKGGPFDDLAFVAGVQYGEISAELKDGTFPDDGKMVYSAIVQQLDLLAMHLKLVMFADAWDEHPEEWTKVRFERAPAE